MTTTAQFVDVKEINQQWIAWAAECVAQGYPHDSLKQAMISEGFTEEQTQTVLGKVKNLPLYKSLEKATQKYKRAYSVMENYRRLQEQDPFYSRIERVSSPSLHEFFYKYWLGCKPVIITNLGKDWPLLKNCTFERLLRDFGDEEVEIQFGRESDENFEINSPRHKKNVKLSWLINQVLTTEESNDFYMTANNQTFAKTKLGALLAEFGTLPPYMSSKKECTGWRHFWIGPKGTVTPLHHDSCALMHMQIHGSKLWRLISPFDYGNLYNHHHVFSKVDVFNIDYNLFPMMKNVKHIDVVINPGETLFLPIGWWHGVKSLGKNISVSMTDFAFSNNEWTYSEVRDDL